MSIDHITPLSQQQYFPQAVQLFELNKTIIAQKYEILT